jgi:hypothetical protein
MDNSSAVASGADFPIFRRPVCLNNVIPVEKRYPARNDIFEFITGTFVIVVLPVSFRAADILLKRDSTDNVRVFTSSYYFL